MVLRIGGPIIERRSLQEAIESGELQEGRPGFFSTQGITSPSLSIPDIIKKPIQNLTTSLSMPQNIAGIGIGGLVIIGIVAFLVFRKWHLITNVVDVR